MWAAFSVSPETLFRQHAAPGRALPADVETDVYRIVPESVDQHVKHVQARQGADLTRGPGLGTTVVLQAADA
jgi:hypothetical protein